MEANSIYEESRKELIRLKKEIHQDRIVINFDRMDGDTKESMINAITNVLDKRSAAVDRVIMGAK
jgi:polyphosphate kinase 2 (PPK2 family)